MNLRDKDEYKKLLKIEKEYQNLLKASQRLQNEKDYYETQLKDKEKSFLQIQTQLQGLKRKIHHHKATWVQIAEDNKRLKEELMLRMPKDQKPFIDINEIKSDIFDLISKVSSGNKKKYQEEKINGLLSKQNFYECLLEVTTIFKEYFEDYSKSSFNSIKFGKNQFSYSIGNNLSPIPRENISDDDIEKLMDESKVLLKTLEKQKSKLSVLNERINTNNKFGP